MAPNVAVIEFPDWRWPFIGGSVVTLIVALLIWKLIPGLEAGAAGQRFDWLGAIGLAAGILSLILAISKGSAWGWATPLPPSLFGISVLALVFWGFWKLRPSPRVLLTATLVNSGVACAYGAMPSIIMSSVPRSETAAGNGFNTLMRSLGTNGNAAVIGQLLAQISTDFHGAMIPTGQGFRTALLLGAGLSVAAVIIAAFIPKNPPRSELEPVDVPLSANAKQFPGQCRNGQPWAPHEVASADRQDPRRVGPSGILD
ncbi:hypothetical protein [Glutamicibacter sp.]|uniref:hypothetical protein n=1 Tax=Glutamicibacter sp. TaxID=1931995 RepID=UPI003D6A44BC